MINSQAEVWSSEGFTGTFVISSHMEIRDQKAFAARPSWREVIKGTQTQKWGCRHFRRTEPPPFCGFESYNMNPQSGGCANSPFSKDRATETAWYSTKYASGEYS